MPNPGKIYFLILSARVVREINNIRDKNASRRLKDHDFMRYFEGPERSLTYYKALYTPSKFRQEA